MKKKKLLKKYTIPALMVIPSILLIGIFFFYPIVETVKLSFYKWNGILQNAPKFIGLKNYQALIKDKTFWTSIKNVGVFLLQGVFIQGPLAFILALFISKKIRGIRFFKFAYFLPVVIPLTAIGIMWKFVLNPNWGLLNALIRFVDSSFNVDFLGNQKIAIYSVVLVSAWVYVGLNMVIFASGLTSIPSEIYESAALDGATGIKQIWHITIPMMMESIKIYIILMITGSLKTFDLVYVMTRGGPNEATSVPAVFMYLETFSNTKFGYGAAIATFILITGLIGSILANRYLYNRE